MRGPFGDWAKRIRYARFVQRLSNRSCNMSNGAGAGCCNAVTKNACATAGETAYLKRREDR
jgi:hypothetical protein